jgi:hypothetical protein
MLKIKVTTLADFVRWSEKLRLKILFADSSWEKTLLTDRKSTVEKTSER